MIETAVVLVMANVLGMLQQAQLYTRYKDIVVMEVVAGKINESGDQIVTVTLTQIFDSPDPVFAPATAKTPCFVRFSVFRF
jgi:hypothetical protein